MDELEDYVLSLLTINNFSNMIKTDFDMLTMLDDGQNVPKPRYVCQVSRYLTKKGLYTSSECN